MPERTTKPRRASRLYHSPEALIWARQAKGWRQGQLAKALEISPAYMSELERGVRSAPPDLLNRIARVLGCPTTILEHRDPSDRDAAELLARIISLIAPKDRAA